MNLKDLFAKAEGGTLTYEQLVALAKETNSKFIDLSEGGYVDKSKYTDDLAARDTRITSLDETVKTRDADLVKLQEQLKSAGTDADKLSTLTRDFAELQKQYEKDTKALEKQMKEQNYKHAVQDFANTQKFSSNAAKRDFVSTLLSKNLQMEGDTILGATDFVTAYAKENEDAFIKEEDKAESQEKPRFADSTENSGGQNDKGESNPFIFNFTGVRPHK